MPSADLVGNGAGTTHAPGGAVEGREHAVAKVLDLLSAKSGELPAHRAVVAVEQSVPAAIAQFGRALGRVDDVGEHHGRQDSVDLGLAARAGQKLLGLADNPVDDFRLEQGNMIIPGQFDVFRARNILGEITPVLDRQRLIANPVHDQGRYTNHREKMAGIDFAVHLQYCDRGRGAGAEALPAGDVAADGLVRRQGRNEPAQRVFAGSPRTIDDLDSLVAIFLHRQERVPRKGAK
jgi:hypothetical protein